MIRTQDVAYHYRLRPAIKDINLHVRPGEVTAIMGPNGAGKSTLLKVLAGLLPPTRGTVHIDGKLRRGSVENELAIRRVTVYLPDQPWIPLHLSGRDFLIDIGELYDVPRERLAQHIPRLLQLFNLDRIADHSMESYSTGQKKKIALCGTLVADTPLLILDEPFTGGLDPSGIAALERVLRSLADRKDVTVVIASQLPTIMENVAHRIALLQDGTITDHATLDDLRRKTRCEGPLQDVLQRLLPGSTASVESYFSQEQ